jgi:hypothetical protein
LDKPYAVFQFKYRSPGVLKGLGLYSEGNEVEGNSEEKEKEKLKQVPQAELIEKMLDLERKLKSRDGGGVAASTGKQGKSSAEKNKKKEKERERERERENQRRMSQKTDGVARNLTEQWVERHSRDPSVKAKSMAVGSAGREKSKKEKEVVGTWEQDVDAGWGGGDVKW